MRNWKTSLSGLVAAAAGFVMFSPALFQRWPWVIELSKYVMAGGMAGVGLFAKDSTTHSTALQVDEATTKAESRD